MRAYVAFLALLAVAVRCALLALVALLRFPALRAEPPELEAPSADKDADPRPQHWPTRVPGPEEQALARFLAAAGTDDDLEDAGYADEQYRSLEQLDEAQLARLSGQLAEALRWPGARGAPTLFTREPTAELGAPQPGDLKSAAKRARYYRRYPWKRRNSRSRQASEYNPCTLTRKEVFKLLVALHDARQGNKSRVVNFCNRKRPASAVYMNIRFLGRRRK